MPTPEPVLLPRAGQHMTTRARWYLAVAATRHLSTAFVAFVMADAFQVSASFIPILSAAPIQFWAFVFLGAGLACAAASILRHEGLARLGMAWSATSTLVVGAGLVIALFTSHLLSPIFPILWLAVAAKDFIVCAQPIRSPFEGLADELTRRRKTTTRKGARPSEPRLVRLVRFYPRLGRGRGPGSQ